MGMFDLKMKDDYVDEYREMVQGHGGEKGRGADRRGGAVQARRRRREDGNFQGAPWRLSRTRALR